MGKSKLSSIGLGIITALAIIFLSFLPINAAIRPHAPQSVRVDNSTYVAISWQDIWDSLRRKKGKGGVRSPDELVSSCLIAPGKLTDSENSEQNGKLEVWTDRPLFVWKGTGEKEIEVRQDRSNTKMWTMSLSPTTQSIIYGGEPLQRGKTYWWRLEDIIYVYFEIMDLENHNRIKAELTALENQLKARNADQEQIIVERVKYFADLGLWSDALKEIYSVSNPSPELTQMLQQIQAHDFCVQPEHEQNISSS